MTKIHTDPKTTLNVIAVYSNSARFKSRLRLFKRFERHMAQFKHVNLLIVEAAFGNRRFEVTRHGNPWHVQVRYFDEMWLKENLINIGLQRLNHIFPDWEYVCWSDADVTYHNRRWVPETIHALQHYMVVQPWTHAFDMDPFGGVLKVHQSFCYRWVQGFRPLQDHRYEFMHPGYSWAARREAIDSLHGGLFDQMIIGSGDHVMALSFVKMGLRVLPAGVSAGLKHAVQVWQDSASHVIREDIGYVNGSLIHSWHGKKVDRQYQPRNKIITTPPPFDPYLDLRRDLQGLWVFSERGMRLRDPIRQYLKSRNEDSVDLE